MKKVVQFLSAALVSLSLVGGIAAASTNGCSISNTGADSVNVCKNTDSNNLDITCDNNVDVVFVNGQNSGSGSVTLNGNTNGGYAFSGNAVNTNDSQLGLDVSCAPATQTSVTPPAGGKGGGTVSAPVTPAPAAVKALPSTGSNTSAVIAGAATTAFAGLALAVRFGASAYRKLF